MKAYKCIRCFLLVTLLGTVAGTAYPQEPKKPKIAASANAQTVYKPLDATDEPKADKVNAAKTNAAKANAGQKPAARAPKANNVTAPKQNPARKNASGAKQGKAVSEANEKQKAAPQKATPRKARSERYVALKNNLPFQVLAMHNLALEVQLQKHITIDFPVTWSISDIEREHAVRGIAFQPEGRWWLKQAGTGHFFGVHAHAAWFNLKWEENRYQTEHRPLLGAGVSYGYKLPLSAHWGAEFNIGAGYANMKYNTYYNIENGAMLNKRVRHYWGITRAGISLVYRF